VFSQDAKASQEIQKKQNKLILPGQAVGQAQLKSRVTTVTGVRSLSPSSGWVEEREFFQTL
jgi:hypothetical protein